MIRILQCIGAGAWAILAFSLYALAILILPIWVLSACAQDQDTVWALKTYRRCEHRTWDGSCTYFSYRQFYSPSYRTYQRAHPRRHTYYLPEDAPRVYGYRRDRDGEEYGGGVDCKSPMRAAGDDKLDQDRAEVSAQDRWAIDVETNYGTKYSDVRYAAGIRTTCVRKVPTSATEKGQAALGVRHHVCIFHARPCAAPAIRQDEDSRAKRRSERVEDPPPAPRRDRP